MRALLLASFLGCAWGQTPDVHDIMARVAENQAKTEDARRQFVYRQKQTVTIRRTNGKVAREERREYEITPEARGAHRDLLARQGRYEKDGDYVFFRSGGGEAAGVVTGIDAGMVDGFSDEMTQENSRDGISNDQFPLTYHQQWKYDFRLAGVEIYRGRRVYRVEFAPHDRFGWKGEAWIDAEEYQPAFVTTKMAHGLPLAVKTLLGTDVHGYGYSVAYQRFEDGVWFPVSYGAEFSIHALFFYKRTITISMTNNDFRRADVTSDVSYSATEP